MKIAFSASLSIFWFFVMYRINQNNPADEQVQEFEASGDNINEDTEPWETYSGDPKGVAIFRVRSYDHPARLHESNYQ